MGRTLSTTLQDILTPAKRDIDHTLDLYFPATAFHFATSTLTAVNGFNYTNDLERVSAIRQTIEAPTDSVSVSIQNLDRVLGLHVANNWQLWRAATAVVGRNYYGVANSGGRNGLTAWVEMFRGAVQRPNADDFAVTFDIIADTVSAGQNVANRNLGPLCPALFKDAATCGYSGGLTTCNHVLRSPAGCDGRANSHRFMGFEHRYNPDVSAPGTGGNGDGDDGGFDPCPRLDQHILVRGTDGQPMAKMVGFVTDDDEIWNPVLKRFFPISKCTIVQNQTIWELVTVHGAVGYSSAPHRIIRDVIDCVGLAVERFAPRERVLGVSGKGLAQTSVALVRPCSHLAAVMRIEMQADSENDKIYCYGDSPDKLITCHNSKPPDDPPIFL